MGARTHFGDLTHKLLDPEYFEAHYRAEFTRYRNNIDRDRAAGRVNRADLCGKLKDRITPDPDEVVRDNLNGRTAAFAALRLQLAFAAYAGVLLDFNQLVTLLREVSKGQPQPRSVVDGAREKLVKEFRL